MICIVKVNRLVNWRYSEAQDEWLKTHEKIFEHFDYRTTLSNDFLTKRVTVEEFHKKFDASLNETKTLMEKTLKNA